MDADEYVEAVLSLVETVPRGRVTTYGALADAVGYGGPRRVGRVMSTFGGSVPWWRVVRADGSVPKGRRQRALLEAEGVPFRGERVDMRLAHAGP